MPSNQLLDPDLSRALGTNSPELVWEQIRSLYDSAIVNHPSETERIAGQYGLDPENVQARLGNVEPVMVLTRLHRMFPDLKFQNLMKEVPSLLMARTLFQFLQDLEN